LFLFYILKHYFPGTKFGGHKKNWGALPPNGPPWLRGCVAAQASLTEKAHIHRNKVVL